MDLHAVKAGNELAVQAPLPSEQWSNGGGLLSPAPSSVDSEELQELLEELNIVGKRPFGWDSEGEEEADCWPSGSVIAKPFQHASSQAPSTTQKGSLLPPPPPQQEEAEVIEILDSSSSESEEEWSVAAPNTARKQRRVVDSEDEDEEDLEGSKPAVLPAFFAAIPSLAAASLPPPQQPPAPRGRPQQPQQQPQPQQAQQHAAGPPLRAGNSATVSNSASRPPSAAAWKKQREAATATLFEEFNRTVFGGRLPADLEVKWNARLLTTAGLTHYRRDIPDDPYAPPIYTARVELSSKVLDGFSKLERTLCHELCHVAAWLLDHTAKPPHGPVFKAWAEKAMRLYTHLDITTCHANEIFYPFRWQCTNSACLQQYGRHSNSIDVAKKVCGACRSPLSFLGRFKADGTPAKPRSAATSKFIEFVKENHAQVRKELPAGTPQKAVMQHLSVKYAEARQLRQQQQQQVASDDGGGMAGNGSSASASTALL